MSKILVHIYSYKEKNLVDSISVLRSRLSGNNQVHFYVSDQNNLTRLKYFTDKDVFYNVIWWDELISPVLHNAKCVVENANSGYDYVLLIDREVYFPNNWDEYLISNLPKSGVVSGIGNFSTSVKDNFYINKDFIDTSELSNTSYVDHSLVFGKYQDFINIDWPLQLKYYGIDEYLSIDFLNKGLGIYSLPSSLFSYLSPAIHNRGYVPFSINHNYNEVLDLIINNKTEKLKYQDPKLFIENNQIDASQLHKLPFDFNDIEYNRSSSLDLVGGKRYIEKLNSVS
jgi:hypothetical protein